MADDVKINRAPVLTLWPAVVAERLGFDWEEALTLGRASRAQCAQQKREARGCTSQPLKRSANAAARRSAARRGGLIYCIGRSQLFKPQKDCAL